MIARLSGTVVQRDAKGIVLDCRGVGYGVSMSLMAMAQVGAEGSEATVHVHTHVGQDALALFGFVDRQELDTFRVLITTSGVGPRLALSILSSWSPAELAGIVERKDKAALVRIPGVGNKKADRLFVELAGRLSDIAPAEAPSPDDALHRDLQDALLSLGFKEQEAGATARKVLEEAGGERDLATLVRNALRAGR